MAPIAFLDFPNILKDIRKASDQYLWLTAGEAHAGGRERVTCSLRVMSHPLLRSTGLSGSS